MLRRDHLVKVLDFGLAKLIESEQGADIELSKVMPLTSPGVFMGAARYMSPQQARGLPLDARTDIWSLGVVLYELVTKHAPFTGKTLSDVIVAVLTTHPPTLTRYAPNVPAELDRIITKTLRKDEGERYQTAKDLGLDLKALKQRLDFEAELGRSGEKLGSGKVERIVTSREQAETDETLVRGQTNYWTASHPQAESDQAVANRESGLTRLKVDTDPHLVATTQSEAESVSTKADSIVERLSEFAHQRWKVLTAVATLTVVALAVGFLFRGHRSIKLTDKDIVVLAAFSNTTGDPVFDDSLPQGLATVLQQSPFLSLLPERKVRETLKLMGRSTEESLTTEIAEEICQRTGSKAVLAGSIASLGNEYVISLSATECQTGVSMARQQVRAAKREEVLDALGYAATSLRETIGESLSTIQKYDTPIAQATTPSLDALKVYSLGLKTMNQQGDSGAIPHFKRAIEIDPNFALAYAKLAVAYDNLRES